MHQQIVEGGQMVIAGQIQNRHPADGERKDGLGLFPIRLRNGRSVRVRPVRPTDAAAIQDFVRHLSHNSRRLRFFAPIRELAPATLARLIESAARRGQALLAEARDGETSCMVGLSEYAMDDHCDDGGTCEVASSWPTPGSAWGWGACSWRRCSSRRVTRATRAP